MKYAEPARPLQGVTEMKDRIFKDDNYIVKLQNWYKTECNEDWEHTFGIKIETIDNPGWIVTIDLNETNWENLIIDRYQIMKSGDDWFEIQISNSQFIGSGGSANLEDILKSFFNIINSKGGNSSPAPSMESAH
jgi:hypothetical protein